MGRRHRLPVRLPDRHLQRQSQQRQRHADHRWRVLPLSPRRRSMDGSVGSEYAASLLYPVVCRTSHEIRAGYQWLDLLGLEESAR